MKSFRLQKNYLIRARKPTKRFSNSPTITNEISMDYTSNDKNKVRKVSNMSDGMRVEPWATQDEPGFTKHLF